MPTRPGRTSCPSRVVHYPPLSEQPHMRQIIGNVLECVQIKNFNFNYRKGLRVLQSLTSTKSNMRSK